MDKNQAVGSSKRADSNKEIFILDPAHQTMVTGGINYRMLVTFLIPIMLVVIPLFFLQNELAKVRGNMQDTKFIAAVPLIGFFVIFGLFLLLVQLPPILHLWRMQLNGQIIWGETKKISGERVYWTGAGIRRKETSGKSYDVMVYCQFKNPQGRMISTHATCPRGDLRHKALPQKAVVAILYVSDQNFMVL